MAFADWIPTTTADPAVKAILRAVGLKSRKATIIPAETCEYWGTYWDEGTRYEYTAVRLADFQAVHGPQFNPPQFGGPQKTPVVAVPPGIVVVKHGISCGKPAHPFIHANPADLVGALRGATSPALGAGA